MLCDPGQHGGIGYNNSVPTTVGSSVEKARKEERAEGRTDIE